MLDEVAATVHGGGVTRLGERGSAKMDTEAFAYQPASGAVTHRTSAVRLPTAGGVLHAQAQTHSSLPRYEPKVAR